MRYIARLTGVLDLPRPVQVLGQDLTLIRVWARAIMKSYPQDRHPHAAVVITEEKEVEVEVIGHG